MQRLSQSSRWGPESVLLSRRETPAVAVRCHSGNKPKSEAALDSRNITGTAADESSNKAGINKVFCNRMLHTKGACH